MPTKFSRRSILAASGVGAVTLVTGLGTQLAVAQTSAANREKLVVLMLAGGADGLHLAPPVSMASYYDRRGNLAIARPNQNGGALPLTSASANGNAVFPTGLDGVFGLHPVFSNLYPWWESGNLALVPGTGLPGISRSHFRAQPKIRAGSMGNVSGGWLGRLMAARGNPSGTPLQAVSAPGANARFIAGLAPSMAMLGNLDAVGMNGFADKAAATAALRTFHTKNDTISVEGAKLLNVIDSVDALDRDLRPGYQNTSEGRAFSELAMLLEADVGIEAAALTSGGWDHHANLLGRFARTATPMARALAAFANDTGLEGITVMVVTEFGRTLGRNNRGGTDHGRGFTAFVLGKGIQGGVFGDFPSNLTEGREIPTTTDFRKIAAEIATNRLGVNNMGSVFPGFNPGGQLGLTRP